MNSYTTDGLTRYLQTPSGGSPNNFCTGDVNNGTANVSGITTSYDLRNPTDTYNPQGRHPGQRRASASTSRTTPPPPAPRHPAQLLRRQQHDARQHQDRDLQRRAREGLPPVGEALHVHPDRRPATTTSRSAPTSRSAARADGEGGYTEQPERSTPRPATTPACTAAATTGSRSASTGSAPRRGLGLRLPAMSIYANYNGANTTFNLVRVIPAAATKTLNIGFYDVGDASQPRHRPGAAAARLQPRRHAHQLHRRRRRQRARSPTAS